MSGSNMLEALFIGTAAFAGLLSQRIVGFGVPSFLVPVLLIYFSPPVAILIFLLVGTSSNLMNIFAHRDKREIMWPIIIRLFVAALPGSLLGAFVVTHVANKSLMQILIGLLVIASLSIQEFVFPKPNIPLRVSKGISMSGFLAGFLNSSFGVSASALILWFRTHICRPNQIRHNLAVIFTLMNLVSFTLIYLNKPEALNAQPFVVFAWLVPVILIGHFLGRLLVKRINAKQFEKVVFVAVITTGLLSIVIGITGLK